MYTPVDIYVCVYSKTDVGMWIEVNLKLRLLFLIYHFLPHCSKRPLQHTFEPVHHSCYIIVWKKYNVSVGQKSDCCVLSSLPPVPDMSG